MKTKMVLIIIISMSIFQNKLVAQYYSVGKVYGFACTYTSRLPLANEWDKVAWVSNIFELDVRNKYYLMEDDPKYAYADSRFSSWLLNHLKNDEVLKKYKGCLYDYSPECSESQIIQKKRQDKINELIQQGYKIIEVTGFKIYQHPLSDYPTTNENNQQVKPQEKTLQLNTSNATTANNNKTNEDFWNTPENTLTVQQQQRQEEEKRQAKIKEQERQNAITKENALKKPFTWNVNNRDTVSEINLLPVKSLNPYFNNGTITLSSVNKGKVIGTANNITTNLPLAEGWNTLRIALKGTNYNLKDSVKVYYKKSSRKVLLFDDFNEVELDKNIWNFSEFDPPILQSGFLIISKSFLESKFKSDNRKKITLEFKYKFKVFPKMYNQFKMNLRFGSYISQIKDFEHTEFIYITENDHYSKQIPDYFIPETWIIQRVEYNPNDHSFKIYFNNQLVMETTYKDDKYYPLSFDLHLSNALSITELAVDYVKIYQE